MPLESNPETWLTLREAAERLSVHPKTLRRWADDGNIPCMLTPGGHRRFATTDVSELMGVRNTVGPREKVARAWARRAMADVRGRARDADVLVGELDEESREEYRILGRSLLGLVTKYASSSKDLDSMTAEAAEMGRDYARLSRQTGLSVCDALKMSMFFRETVIGAALDMSEGFHIRADNEAELIRTINQLINNVQMAVVEVYNADNTDTLPRS
jgi:excisionase family DNA binding protein